jgi:hypothetical protein
MLTRKGAFLIFAIPTYRERRPFMKLRIALAAAVVIVPAVAFSQRPVSPVPGALVKKTLPTTAIGALTGTRLSSVTSYNGTPCADGCLLATGIGGPAGVVVHFGDGSVRVEEVRASLIVPHGKPHAVRLLLDRSEILGVQCDAHGALKASPVFQPLGATSKGYKWAIFRGATMLNSGHSNGEPVAWNGDGHTAGAMQLAVFSDVTIEISHGDSRLVMTSDNGPAIETRTGGTLSYNDLGIQLSGVPDFAVTGARIQGVNR